MVIYKCNLCNFVTKIKTQYKTHLETKKHKKNEEKNGVNIGKMSTNRAQMSKSEHKVSTNLGKEIRYQCKSLYNNKRYLFNPLAEVKI